MLIVHADGTINFDKVTAFEVNERSGLIAFHFDYDNGLNLGFESESATLDAYDKILAAFEEGKRVVYL
jgi:hypothetical protein